MARKLTTLRLTEEQDKMLDELAAITQQGRNEVITNLIVGEHDRINGNPAVKQLMEQMNLLANQMKEYAEGTKTDKKIEG